MPIPNPDVRLILTAQAIWKHARGCKKATSECIICQLNMRWFGEVPLPKLSFLLSEQVPVKVRG